MTGCRRNEELVRRANAPQTVAARGANDEPQVPGALQSVGREKRCQACTRGRLRVAVKRSRDISPSRQQLFILSNACDDSNCGHLPVRDSLAERPLALASPFKVQIRVLRLHPLSIIISSLPSAHNPLSLVRPSRHLNRVNRSLILLIYLPTRQSPAALCNCDRPATNAAVCIAAQHCAPTAAVANTQVCLYRTSKGQRHFQKYQLCPAIPRTGLVNIDQPDDGPKGLEDRRNCGRIDTGLVTLT